MEIRRGMCPANPLLCCGPRPVGAPKRAQGLSSGPRKQTSFRAVGLVCHPNFSVHHSGLSSFALSLFLALSVLLAGASLVGDRASLSLSLRGLLPRARLPEPRLFCIWGCRYHCRCSVSWRYARLRYTPSVSSSQSCAV